MSSGYGEEQVVRLSLSFTMSFTMSFTSGMKFIGKKALHPR